jgi:hypothetical protein
MNGNAGKRTWEVPKPIADMRKRNPHNSDFFRELNAVYFYNKRQLEKNIAEREAAQVATGRKQQEKEFPSDGFIECGASGENKVRGTVYIQDSSLAVCVEGFAIAAENGENDSAVLLVLRHVSETQVEDSSMTFYRVLCDPAFLPKRLVKDLQKGFSKKKSEIACSWNSLDWSHSFGHLKRQNHEGTLHLCTEGPFINRTCDNEMMESLRSDLVAIRTTPAGFTYCALPLPFAKGRVLPQSDVFELGVGEEGDAMRLNTPLHNELPKRVLSCALFAKNCLRTEHKSANGILGLLESFSSKAPRAVTDRYQSLNVALGGTTQFSIYGMFYPCHKLEEESPFPNGSFSTAKCSCDVQVLEGASYPLPCKVISFIQKNKGGNKGHNV